jgi:hypothetical protein
LDSVEYKISYQVASQLPETLLPEGTLGLHSGGNQLEVLTGVIPREVAKPAVSGTSYYINATSVTGTNLKNRAERILAVYRNGVLDKKWVVQDRTASGDAYGKVRVTIATTDYDPTAEYTVTYQALDRYSLTTNVLDVTAYYNTNLKTVVDQLVQQLADVATLVSIMMTTKANAGQGQWIAPTLLNSWVNASGIAAGYLKDTLGFIRIRGTLASGVMTAGTVLFNLPAGYRPEQTVYAAVLCNNGTTYSPVQLAISTAGAVTLVSAAAYNGALLLDIPPFRAV